MKKKFYVLILPIITLIPEILPYGAVLNFANPEGAYLRKTFSYFDLTPFGYANFTPFITAVLTCVVIILLVVYCATDKAGLAAAARGILLAACAVSLGPLMLGVSSFSAVGALITALLIAELVVLHLHIKTEV